MKPIFIMLPQIDGGVVHVNMNLVTTVARDAHSDFTVLCLPGQVVRTTFTPIEVFDLMESQS